MTSKISWTEQTWNPIVGCSKVSDGCKNCYAERMAKRLKAMGQPQYQEVVDENGWTGVVAKTDSMLKPFTWKKSRMIFVCSMSDLFHRTVPEIVIDDVMRTICENPQHTFQVLTKRPLRIRNYFRNNPVPDNVWLGVTAENQQTADERIAILTSMKAKVRFASIEPMLGDIYLDECGGFNLDWVILGGESGTNARPMHPDWVRSIQEQCKYASIPFHFKQWGEWAQVPTLMYGEEAHGVKYLFKDGLFGTQKDWYNGNAVAMFKYGKKQNGHLLDGIEYREMPNKI